MEEVIKAWEEMGRGIMREKGKGGKGCCGGFHPGLGWKKLRMD